MVLQYPEFFELDRIEILSNPKRWQRQILDFYIRSSQPIFFFVGQFCCVRVFRELDHQYDIGFAAAATFVGGGIRIRIRMMIVQQFGRDHNIEYYSMVPLAVFTRIIGIDTRHQKRIRPFPFLVIVIVIVLIVVAGGGQAGVFIRRYNGVCGAPDAGFSSSSTILSIYNRQ